MTGPNQDAQHDYRRLFERIPCGVYQTTPAGQIVAANPALLEMLGYQSLEELGRVDIATTLYINPTDRQAWAQRLERKGQVQDMEIILRRKDGSQIVALDNASVIRDENGEARFYEGTLTDITARKQTEEELRRSEKRFRDLFEASPDAIFVEDLEGNVLDANPAATVLQGIERQKLIGMNISELVPPEYVEFAQNHQRQLVEGEVEQIEGFTWAADGRAIPIEIRARLEYGGQGAVLIHVRDITERKEQQKRLEQLAQFDSLTGLPNRFLFEDRLKQAVLGTRRTGERIALHYLDLDEFKQVNDTLGHSVGDELLKAVGQRLTKLVRETDTVARLGGDEFAIIQTDIHGATGASAFALRIQDAMIAPFTAAENEIHTSTSIGITVSSPGDEPSELLLQADRALYKAKERGRQRFHFHNQELAEEVERYVSIRRDLRDAVGRDEFFLEFQPQVNLRTGDIVGSEALVRWQHPRRGRLPPAEFIPVTENTGLISAIGDWVLEAACRQRREWCDRGLTKIPVAVNLSGVQFKDPRFADKLQTLLETTGVQPDLLELELTETILMQGSQAVQRALTQSDESGISIAIDDFGTGYSSLQYLREFPVSRLKIAMEFVQGVTEDPDDAAIVAAVISLGHELGMRVIAEGVETEEQVEFLKAHDCDDAQGFYFSQPLAAETFAQRLNHPSGQQVP
jgi:Amt family ammonium transporter